MDETIRTFLSPKVFYDKLAEYEIDFFSGVPDSLLKDICKYITDNTPEDKHVIAANEGNSIAIATGYHLATNKIPLVYLQNSGFGNIINPLTSLVHEQVYNIPMLLLIGWRGEPGKKDEPQHKSMGKIQIKLLETLGIKCEILPDYNEGAIDLIDRAYKYMKETNKPFAFLVKKQTFLKQEINTVSNNYKFKREELLSIILKEIDESNVILSTTGMLSRELYEYRVNNNEELRDFLSVGSMGHCSSIALGVSLATKKNTVVLDGDGALIMHMGSMCVNGNQSPKNFKHILFNNGAHDSVGGQLTVGFDVNFSEIAKSCGYNIIICTDYNNENCVKESVKKLLETDGPVFLEVRCDKGARSDLGRPPSSLENKELFIKHLLK
jgi:phosphonopyruvate decarboxylase